MSSAAVGEVMESVSAKTQERFSDAGDQGREVVGQWLAEWDGFIYGFHFF